MRSESGKPTGTSNASNADKARTDRRMKHLRTAMQEETIGEAELFHQAVAKVELCTVQACDGRKCAKFLPPASRGQVAVP